MTLQILVLTASMGMMQQGATPPSSDTIPVSIDRIQRALSRPPAIAVKGADEERPVFRSNIVEKAPTLAELLGPDFLKGPIPPTAGGMTHQEFLDLVTPKDVRGYAAFSNGEALTVAATSMATALALKALNQAVHKFESARVESEKQAARKEVEDALAALRKARSEAGLPEK
jgi:hypothetical protein